MRAMLFWTLTVKKAAKLSRPEDDVNRDNRIGTIFVPASHITSKKDHVDRATDCREERPGSPVELPTSRRRLDQRAMELPMRHHLEPLSLHDMATTTAQQTTRSTGGRLWAATNMQRRATSSMDTATKGALHVFDLRGHGGSGTTMELTTLFCLVQSVNVAAVSLDVSSGLRRASFRRKLWKTGRGSIPSDVRDRCFSSESGSALVSWPPAHQLRTPASTQR
ncbi:uncharacterized protein [Dermacentor albipictus]|uniref:uncharacterized protein isoform X2 n=1 Tax=Dermacentor albipictus TaxID=60249 RepID=UPI0038FD3673